jgi:hypothetical protein
VLPALNLSPEGFVLEPAAVDRARRATRPRWVVLAGPGTAFLWCHAGLLRPGAPAERHSEAVLHTLAALPAPARAACRGAVVVWETGDGGDVFAVALRLAADEPKVIATSWSPPHEWPEPFVDATLPPEEALEAALQRLSGTVATSRGAAAVDTAVKVVGLALRRLGGEPVDDAGRPATDAGLEAWSGWRSRWMRSVQAEARRAAGLAPLPAAAPTPADGPLQGLLVFVSYARPDAATLAWPVNDALVALGATVWLDQERALDAPLLERGLHEVIGECDAYLMCASDEFLERAGYATQELAWAIAHADGDRPLRRVIAVVPGTLLPSVVAGWPTIEFDGDAAALSRGLRACLQAPPAAASAPSLATVDLRPPPPLPPRADVVLARRRVWHSERFDAMNELDLQGADPRLDATQLGLADGLGWNGRLVDHTAWPDDAVVRDLRWRLASMRVVRTVRWPLAGALHDEGALVDDLRVLAEQPVPLREWAAVNGWAEDERRFALRWHAGLLRVLQTLLRRGLWAGLLATPTAQIDRWTDVLAERRRECLDAMLVMRLTGSIGWQREFPSWDAGLREMRTLLKNAAWTPEPPAALRLMMTHNAPELSAVIADVAWRAARDNVPAWQLLPLSQAACDEALVGVGADSSVMAAPVPVFTLTGICDTTGSARIELGWPKVGASAGRASVNVSGQLARSFAAATRSII